MCSEAEHGRPDWAVSKYYQGLLKADSIEPVKAGYYPFELYLSRFFFKVPNLDYGDVSDTNMQLCFTFIELTAEQANVGVPLLSCTICRNHESHYCHGCLERARTTAEPRCTRCRELMAPICAVCAEAEARRPEAQVARVHRKK